MTVIKNHFEVFLMTSKKQGSGIIESKVGLYSFTKFSDFKNNSKNFKQNQKDNFSQTDGHFIFLQKNYLLSLKWKVPTSLHNFINIYSLFSNLYI
jgi:hypothetical protein